MNESVVYRGRRFVLIRRLPDGWAIIRDDEGEELRVRETALRPA